MPRPDNTPRQRTRPDLDEIEEKLRIDEDDLDTCLVEQPEYFRHAAALASTAADRLASLELEMKELYAELDLDVRAKHVREETKFSENSLANELRNLPRIKELARKILTAKRA